MTAPIYHDCPLSERPWYVVFEHTGPRKPPLTEFWKVTAVTPFMDMAERWANAVVTNRGERANCFIYECGDRQAEALRAAKVPYSDEDVARFRVIGRRPVEAAE